MGLGKTCSRCSQTLPYGSFTKRKRSKDGHESICKDCKKRVNKYSYRKRLAEGSESRKVPQEKSLKALAPGIVQFYADAVPASEISVKSVYDAQWECPYCNYSWKQSVASMTRKVKHPCPNCTIDDNGIVVRKGLASPPDQWLCGCP